MGEGTLQKSTKPADSGHATEDLTGRDRLAWNAVVSWISQIVVIITGFVLPRLMHETLGQAVLGIWDFAWTFVNYFNLMSLGIGSSVNRYIAKYRSEGRSKELNRLVSTVVLIQVVISFMVVLVTLGAYYLLEIVYAEKLGEHLRVGQAIVFFLGMSLAVENLVNFSRGIITGHHRWDIHNGIYAGSSILTLILMCSVLLLGGSIVDVSIAYFVSTIVTEVCRVYIAYKIASYLRINVYLFSFTQAKQLFVFGAKSFLLAFPRVILVQSVNLVTVAFLGPAALAVFARPFALIRHLYTLVYKFTMMLTPTAGSMQRLEDIVEIRAFFNATLTFNFSIAIPAIMFFMCFGDFIVVMWMGEDYRNWALIAILAVGHLLAIGQDGILRIMQGFDMHGKMGIYLFIAVFSSAILSFYFLNQSQWSLLSSALLLTIPMTFAFGVVLPIYSCRALGIKISEYVTTVIIWPMIYNVPFTFGLLLTHFLLEQKNYSFAVLSLILSMMLEGFIYFKYLLPDNSKQKLQQIVRRAL